jgi:hypothetical protein
MKKITLFLLFSFATYVYAQRNNNIGFDIISGYIVGAPKHDLEGNKYNPYMGNTSSAIGIYYERYIEEYPFSLKAGVFFNYQYKCIRSFHLPIDFNGNLLGKRNASTAYLGYTGGFSYNSLIDVSSTISYFVPSGTSAEVSIKKNSYFAPHAGLNAGLNFKRIGISGVVLYHFLVPEFVSYTTTYNNNTITESNTNMSQGVSIRIGLNYRF